MKREADPVLRALAEGKARIRRGWCKGAFTGRNGSVCALGAIGYRSDPLGDPIIPERALRPEAYLNRAADLVCDCGPVNLNDDFDTERRHILGLYDWAAELRRIDLRKGAQ